MASIIPHRRKQVETPWGPSQHEHEVAPGITRYSTAGHGGFRLSPERQERFRRRFPSFRGFAGECWYEEDCDVCAVVLAFDKEFTPEQVRSAMRIARMNARWEREPRDPRWKGVPRSCWTDIEKWLDSDDPIAQSIRYYVAQWEQEHGDHWEVGSMGAPPAHDGCKYPDRAWSVSFTRVSDGAKCHAVLKEYPRANFMTQSEIDAMRAEPINRVPA